MQETDSRDPSTSPGMIENLCKSAQSVDRLFCERSVNFFEDIAYPVAKFPVWIMRLELSHVADPPDVVADAIGFLVAPV